MHFFQPCRLAAFETLGRHHHAQPYAAVVLAGSYEESGDAGRFRVGPGDVLFHDAFSAHANRIARRSAIVVNLPLPFCALPSANRGTIADPDQLVRFCDSDREAALSCLLDTFDPCDEAEQDAPDLLASALRLGEPPAINQWANANGLSREHVSRAFSKVYGVSPTRYRVEARARKAWRMIVERKGSLAAIAADSGFADQAHMTRSVKRFTGATPVEWRNRLATV